MDNQAARELDYGFTIAIQGMIRAMGMHWENVSRVENGNSPAYGERAFDDLIEELGLHHNNILTRWQDKG